MKIFIINLKRNSKRKELMEKQLMEIEHNYEFFEAIDGSKLQNFTDYIDQHKCFQDLGRLLTAGEVGCWLSHKEIWEEMVAKNIEEACILEDDVLLDNNFNTILNQFSALITEKSILYYLQKNSVSNNEAFLPLSRLPHSKNYSLGIYKWPGFGTQGYIINLSAVEQILAKINLFSKPVDNFLIHIWNHKVPIMNLSPTIVCPVDRGSELDPDRNEAIININLYHKSSICLMRISRKLRYFFWFLHQYGIIKLILLTTCKKPVKLHNFIKS